MRLLNIRRKKHLWAQTQFVHLRVLHKNVLTFSRNYSVGSTSLFFIGPPSNTAHTALANLRNFCDPAAYFDNVNGLFDHGCKMVRLSNICQVILVR